MKYAFIAFHEKEFSVKRMCRVLRVGRSGYYAFCKRPQSAREKANLELLIRVREVFFRSRKTYGSVRIRRYFLKKGMSISRHRVARLMKEDHLVPKKAAKWHPQTTKQQMGARTAPNILDQDFRASFPNQKWVGDITYIETAEGWLYLAVILDLFSRRIVGWSMGERINTELVEGALEMAIASRHPSGEILHHTDRGCQYTSEGYWKKLLDAGFRVSMSRTGNPYDNAAMESFFATLKGECVDKPFKTRAEAKSIIFEYIEVWYNRERMHSTLGYLSPMEFEQASGH